MSIETQESTIELCIRHPETKELERVLVWNKEPIEGVEFQEHKITFQVALSDLGALYPEYYLGTIEAGEAAFRLIQWLPDQTILQRSHLNRKLGQNTVVVWKRKSEEVMSKRSIE